MQGDGGRATLGMLGTLLSSLTWELQIAIETSSSLLSWSMGL